MDIRNLKIIDDRVLIKPIACDGLKGQEGGRQTGVIIKIGIGVNESSEYLKMNDIMTEGNMVYFSTYADEKILIKNQDNDGFTEYLLVPRLYIMAVWS